LRSKLTRLTRKIAIQLHLVAESCTTYSYRSRQPVWKLLDLPSYGMRRGSPIRIVVLLGRGKDDSALR